MRVEFKKKLMRLKTVGLLSILAVFGLSPAARAVTSLKQVQISNGSQIDLLFDGKVQKGQIRTEFFNDIIQLSVSDVSVYPAKISSVNGGSLTKIFAYQYAPKLVRCRLTVKGKAESYKDKIEIKAGGKILTIRVDREGLPQAVPATTATQDPEERALLNRVLAAESAAAQPSAPVKAPVASVAKDAITLSAAAPLNTENLPIHTAGAKLAGGKPLPSPLRAFGKMGLVLGLFGALAFAFRRFTQNKAQAGQVGGSLKQAVASSTGFFGTLGSFAKKGLTRNGKMIEVLSTHYLGPKKSIAVVRVAGRMLVLGVSNDAINLITQLSGDEADPLSAMESLDLGGLGLGVAPAPAKSSGVGATAAGKAVFADLLTAERSKPSVSPNPAFQKPQYGSYGQPSTVVPGASADSLSSVRAQIRSRLEGLKQL